MSDGATADGEARRDAASAQQRVGVDPPESAIFLAWPTPALERRAAARGTTVEALARTATSGDTACGPPPYTALRGARVPDELCAALRGALEATLWPAAAQRSGVETQHYLVLRRHGNEPYEALKAACESVMAWADPTFPYDHLAITSNFVASPHVDMRDVSFQYAMALGDFEGGGELCVEAADGRTRWCVETRGRLARFDGRAVHWVRSYTGQRWSVVWYVNREESATPQTFDVDAAWRPAGDIVADANKQRNGDRGSGGGGVADHPDAPCVS